MGRLFLDANVLFSAAYRPEAGLVRLWTLKDVVLCTSHYAAEEASLNLSDDVQNFSQPHNTCKRFPTRRFIVPFVYALHLVHQDFRPPDLAR
jgi:predicted nucleic acid-binding protein